MKYSVFTKKWTLLPKKNSTKFLIKLSLILSLGLLYSCEPHTYSSVEIAQNCQSFHNPENDWYSSQYEINIESQSVFSDNNKEKINLKIDNKNQSFQYYNSFRNIGFEFTNANCTPLNDSSNCSNSMWMKSFYPYIFGMPCKFFDKSVKLDSSFGGDIINNGIEVFVLHINHEKESWDYYINKTNYKLEGFKFVFNDDPEKGEIVFNEGEKNINGLIVPTKRIWYDLDMNLLGTDILIENE